MKNEKAQGMQFAWIFALIIGGVILFLAIFFSGKLVSTGTYQTQAELTKSMDTLLNAFASIGTAEVSLSEPISLPEKTEINFSCSQIGQTISAKIARGKTPFSYAIKNKYIFSENFNAKELWIFAKPFSMPWRVDDLIYILAKDYCFINPPERIRQELGDLNSSKIQLASSMNSCEKDAAKVCFAGSCEIFVNMDMETVKIKSKSLRFLDDATMYAAIFGPSQYECNLNRLMQRLEVQADLYAEKADILAGRGCFEISSINQEISGLKSAVIKRDYELIKSKAQDVDDRNEVECALY